MAYGIGVPCSSPCQGFLYLSASWLFKSFIVYCRPLYLNASHFVVILGHTLCLVFKVVWVWSILWSLSQPHQLYEPLSSLFPNPAPSDLSTHCTLCRYLCIMLLQILCHHVRVLEPILYDSSFSKGGYTLFCLPCTLEAEMGRSLNSRAACSTECVPGQSELHRRNPVLKNKNNYYYCVSACVIYDMCARIWICTYHDMHVEVSAFNWVILPALLSNFKKWS